ncbi:MAG: NrfD/PsrC family molybdoenzyme membrane anchor subunit [Vicinamibacterales bacterium]
MTDLVQSSGYHGFPMLKGPVWTWEIPAYFFVGGAAGAAALIGAVARRTGADEAIVRDARWIAAAGAALSPPLLISDLGRPERFLNMLRVFKVQSPMSVGAWTLVAFSTFAGAAAFADLAGRAIGGRLPVRLVGDASEMLAAATGMVLSTYTGVLLGATAIPVWSKNARVLPVHFGASGLGSAVSMLELLGHRTRALNALGIGAALVETGLAARVELSSEPALSAIKNGDAAAFARAGAVLSGPLPLALRLFAAGSPSARRLAAASTIAGSMLTRIAWISAGRIPATRE